jgi:hypothetical protein
VNSGCRENPAELGLTIEGTADADEVERLPESVARGSWL